MWITEYLKLIQNFFLDLFFPKFCFSCQKEGGYLCQDCQGLLEILDSYFCLCKEAIRLPLAGKCKRCSHKKLTGLYFAASYQNPLIKKLIHNFKYEPFLRELRENLASLVITHFQLTEKQKTEFSNFLLIPVPLDKKRLKWRGFNQSEEIGKELAKSLEIPLITDVLLKMKATLPQVELSDLEREENIKGAFLVTNREKIKGRKILLIDDVYTTGSTLNEVARLLKEAGASQAWGVVVARG